MEPFVNINHSAESAFQSIGSDEEESFVVLGRESSDHQNFESPPEVLPPLRSTKIHEMQSLIEAHITELSAEPAAGPSGIEASCSTIAHLTISSDTSIEEVHKQVEELIKENENLKNVIAQNNLSFKTQCDRFVAYRDQVANVMKVNRDKFNEANAYIDKMKEQNVKFANEIEVYVNIKKLQEEEILRLKRTLRQYENVQDVNVKSEENILEFDLKAASDQIATLQDELARANIKANQLHAENDRLTAKLVNSPKLENDLTARTEKIGELSSENANLKSEVVRLCANVEAYVSKNTELEKTLERTLDENKSQVQTEAASFQKQLKDKEDVVVNLQTEIQVLTRRLLEVQGRSDPMLNEQCLHLRAQLSVAQRTITALEQAREDHIRQIEDLRRLLQDNNARADMYALEEQVKVYESDFQAERESKEAIKKQKDQIAEDLKNVQKRNKELQNEIELLRARTTRQPQGFLCPKCQFGFSDYQALENHVERCLNLD